MQTLMRLECMHCGTAFFASSIDVPCPTCFPAEQIGATRLVANSPQTEECKMTDKRPQTANEVLAQVDEDHDWKYDPADHSTTPGIQKTLERHRVAIQRLADFIDGKYEGEAEPGVAPAKTWYGADAAPPAPTPETKPAPVG